MRMRVQSEVQAVIENGFYLHLCIINKYFYFINTIWGDNWMTKTMGIVQNVSVFHGLWCMTICRSLCCSTIFGVFCVIFSLHLIIFRFPFIFIIFLILRFLLSCIPWNMYMEPLTSLLIKVQSQRSNILYFVFWYVMHSCLCVFQQVMLQNWRYCLPASHNYVEHCRTFWISNK